MKESYSNKQNVSIAKDLTTVLGEHPEYAPGVTEWKVENELFGGDNKYALYADLDDSRAESTSWESYQKQKAKAHNKNNIKSYLSATAGKARAVAAGVAVVAGAAFGGYMMHLAQDHKVPQAKISYSNNACDGLTGTVKSAVYDSTRHTLNLLVDGGSGVKLCKVSDGVSVTEGYHTVPMSAQEATEALSWHGSNAVPVDITLHDANHDGTIDGLEVKGSAAGYSHIALDQKSTDLSSDSRACEVAPRAPKFSGGYNSLSDHALVSDLLEKANQTGCNQIEIDTPANLDDLVWVANEASNYNMSLAINLDHMWEDNYAGFDAQNVTNYKNQTLRRAERIVSAVGSGNPVVFNLGRYKENDPGYVQFVNNELLPLLKSMDGDNQYELTVAPEHLAQADTNFDQSIVLKTNYSASDALNDTVNNLSAGRSVVFDVSTSAYNAQSNSIDLNNQRNSLEDKLNDLQERNNTRVRGVSVKMTDDYWLVGGPHSTKYGDSNQDPVPQEALGLLAWTDSGDGTVFTERPAASVAAQMLNYMANQTANQTAGNNTNGTNPNGTGNNNTNGTNPNGTGNNTNTTTNQTKSQPIDEESFIDELKRYQVLALSAGAGLAAVGILDRLRKNKRKLQAAKAEGRVNDRAEQLKNAVAKKKTK